MNCALPATSPIAQTPERAGLEPLVDVDEAAFGQRDSPFLESDPFGVGNAAGRDQDVTRLQDHGPRRRVCPHRDAFAGASRDLPQPHAKMDRHPLVADHLEQRFGNLLVLAAGELIAMLEYGYPGTEAAERLGEFKPYIAAAHHEQVVGNPAELERLDMRQRNRGRQPRHVRDRRVSAKIEEQLVGRQCRGAALVQRYLDPSVSDRRAWPMISSAPLLLNWSRCMAIRPSTISRLRARTRSMSIVTGPVETP